MNRKLIAQIIAALLTYFGLTQAGWTGTDPREVTGVGLSINPELLKIILSAASVLVVPLANRFVPGLGDAISKLLDYLLKKPAEEPQPAEATGLINVSLNRDKLTQYMQALRMLKDLLQSHPEAAELIKKLVPIVWDVITRGPEIVPKNEQQS